MSRVRALVVTPFNDSLQIGHKYYNLSIFKRIEKTVHSTFNFETNNIKSIVPYANNAFTACNGYYLPIRNR